MQNTFYALFGGTYDQSDLDALASNVDVTIAAEWLPLQTTDAVYDRTEAKGLNAENDFEAVADASGGSGGRANIGLPNNVTVAVKKSSGLSGRSARGRNFWVGTPINELTSNENKINAAYLDLVEAAIDKVRDAINASFLFEAVLVSRFAGGAQRTLGVTFGWISTTCVNNNVDSQRGRLTK
jgi:hypothetical protein